MLNRIKFLVFVFLVALSCQGCLFTKILTTPMRIVGGAVSIVPAAGDIAHDAIDEMAEEIDQLPF